MSKNRGQNKKKKLQPCVGDRGREAVECIQDDNPVMQMFYKYRDELDEKHDRYEKIVKISRDITIENKRIIFLLHNINTDIANKRETILDEAITRLQQVVDKNFKSIAVLLKDFDHYQYQKAYTSGLQEFLEALIFYQFLRDENIGPYSSINELFQFNDDEDKQLTLLCPQLDYILGIADFTGELMRRCINNLGIGNVDECFKICNLVRYIHTGFLGLMNHGSKELNRKSYVLKQSLTKMELVCYNIKIRGSEIPKHMLVNVIESNDVNNDDDEGYSF